MNKSDSEIWKTYPEFDFIQGSNLGQVRTVGRTVTRNDGKKQFVKGRTLKQWHNSNGYLGVTFSVNGKTVQRYVHRLIAQTFIPNPDKLPEVNHKNCVRTDNRIKNLEWVTHEENVEYREKHGKSSAEVSGRPVYAVSLKTLEVQWFKTQSEAGRELGVNGSNVNNVLKGHYKQAGGFWFTYSDNNTVENVGVKFGDEVACKVEQLIN